MRLLFAVTLLFFVEFSLGQDASWPKYHGPRQDNRSSDTGLLKEWPEGGPKLLWAAELPGKGVSGYSSVSISDDRIYTSGNVGEKSCVFCLDMDGKLIWSAENGPAWSDGRKFPGTRSTPSIDGDRVYDETANGWVSCYEAKSGKQIWTRNILDDFEGKNITWGLSESLVIDGERLYCSPGGKKASVAALNKITGETIWTAPGSEEQTSYATPVLIEQNGLRILLNMGAKSLFGLNAETGEALFRFKHIQIYDVNAVTPIYHDGKIFIANTTDGKFNDEHEKMSGAKMLKLTVENGKASVEELWSSLAPDALFDSLILHGGHLFGCSYNYKGGVWLCVSWDDGKTLWEKRDTARGCLSYADGMFYRLAENGRDLALMKPSTEGYELAGRFQIPEGGEGPCWAHPVVFHGRLYVRHGTFLYCYDLSAK